VTLIIPLSSGKGSTLAQARTQDQSIGYYKMTNHYKLTKKNQCLRTSSTEDFHTTQNRKQETIQSNDLTLTHRNYSLIKITASTKTGSYPYLSPVMIYLRQ